jgi:predicted flap endonuclease-1-like 5' DNA nuclease
MLLLVTTPFSVELLHRAQQQDRFSRIPWWVWVLVVVLIVIIVGIIVTLREEEEVAEKQADLQTTPPTPKATESAPAVEKAVTRSTAVGLDIEPGATVLPQVEPAPSPPRPDNLKRVKGIGPKIEKLLKANGITTFAQLAHVKVSHLRALLDEAGWENIADPATWPEQARRLAQTSSRS